VNAFKKKVSAAKIRLMSERVSKLLIAGAIKQTVHNALQPKRTKTF